MVKKITEDICEIDAVRKLRALPKSKRDSYLAENYVYVEVPRRLKNLLETFHETVYGQLDSAFHLNINDESEEIAPKKISNIH